MENRTPKRRRVKDGDDVGSGSDRISKLPDVVLHHILCFLSQKEAVRTCVLSKSWRHLGATRPVIDLRRICDMSCNAKGTNFCENCFRGNNEAFLSVLDKTFRMYHDQNLSTQALRLEMLDVDSQSISVVEKWIPIFLKPKNLCVTTFHLSVDNYTYVSDQNTDWICLDLPSAVLKAESLRNLYLHRCKISSSETIAMKNLQKLSLSHVYIDDETLQKIMSGCPLVQYVELRSCKGLKTINIANENQHLKDFKLFGCYLQNIQISLNWKLNRSNYFPHLKSLYLFSVQLSTELFQNFSCNFPLLEEFTLSCCYGFDEIKLFSHSLKHLTIDLISLIKVDIDAPNITMKSLRVFGKPLDIWRK